MQRRDGLLTGTRTPIVRLGGGCSILLSYEETGGILAAEGLSVSPTGEEGVRRRPGPVLLLSLCCAVLPTAVR